MFHFLSFISCTVHRNLSRIVEFVCCQVKSLNYFVANTQPFVPFSRYFRTLSKQSEIDQSELDAMEEDRERYLRQAVQNYIKCLKHGDKHDIRLFRLVSLWFSNPTSADISGLIMVKKSCKLSYKEIVKDTLSNTCMVIFTVFLFSDKYREY